MAQDLSVHHHLIGSLFHDVGHRDIGQYELRREQIEFFHEHGYLSGIHILSAKQVEMLKEELARLLEAQRDERDLFYESRTGWRAGRCPRKLTSEIRRRWRSGSIKNGWYKSWR